MSEKRAQKVKEYIMNNGIDEKRIRTQGFGESKLMNDCAEGVECTEEEHAKNRRTDFRIFEIDENRKDE